MSWKYKTVLPILLFMGMIICAVFGVLYVQNNHKHAFVD